MKHKHKHKPEYYAVQRDAEEIFRLLCSHEATVNGLAPKYKVANSTLRAAVIEVVGREEYERHIHRGLWNGYRRAGGTVATKRTRAETISAADDYNAEAAAKLHELRTNGLFYDCVGCGWDTRETGDWEHPPERCPKCQCMVFEKSHIH